jgi:two-component system, cell cycle sensor histidine kinase and response regulator CckA
MNHPLRVLHLEDSPRDAELIRALLEAEWDDCHLVQVKSGETFEQAVQAEPFDVILSDYALPQYNGWGALRFARATQPHVPFILLSGTLGEEQAVDSLKNGATDYVLKQRPTRLVSAIRRAVVEAEEREKRREAEQQVRQQAAYLNKARDAIHVRDLQGRIRYWNEGAERIYGWEASEAIGKHAEDLFCKDTATAFAAADQVTKEGEWMGELRGVTKDKRVVIVESRWTLLRDNTAAPDSVLVIDTDITEKKKLEEKFLRAQRMEIIGALAGGIAHDLNNVLSPIMMVTELIREELVSPSSIEMLDTVKMSAQRGAGLVKQILSFARGASGDHTVLHLKHLANEIVKLSRDTFPRPIKIRLVAPEDIHLVKGDPTQLHQVLMNLFVNARDAMPSGGSLTLELSNVTLDQKQTPMQPKPLCGSFVRLTVTDTGIGIPPHLMEKIYEPFFTTKAPDKGTGLGLSTVLGIVKTHHGFLEVSSEPGKGTTFHVYLPAYVPKAEVTPQPQALPVELNPPHPRNVLAA